MWALLIAVIFTVVAGSTIYFSIRKNRQTETTGISQKYGTLCHLIKQDKDVISEKFTAKSLIIKLRDKKDFHSYFFNEVNGKLIVVWTLESKVHGKRGKEWSFDTAADQAELFTGIRSDI